MQGNILSNLYALFHPRQKVFLPVQIGDEKSLDKAAGMLQKAWSIYRVKCNKTSSFHLSNGSQLQENKHSCQSAENSLQKTPFHPVSRQNIPRILEYFSGLVARFNFAHHFEHNGKLRRPWGRHLLYTHYMPPVLF